jgi:hypothetical protein
MPMADQSNITVWIRSEDVDHPKLERLRRAVTVAVGQDNDATRPWVVWGHGLSRAWLFAKLEAGAQVVILPPWTDGGFAGLPPFRAVAVPTGALRLDETQFAVSATSGIEPTPVWQEYGLFEKSKTAWLVAHEPFVGAGRAWLCTAELLVATPTTRPKEARRLTVDLLAFIANKCKKPKVETLAASTAGPEVSGFTHDDVPYLLAFLGLRGPQDVTHTAQFVNRRLGLEPELSAVERLLARPEVQSELQQPIGKRAQLARVVDEFGMRSFRIEIEETAP